MAIPGLTLLRSYRREWLGPDLAAGLALTALLVPQGMAYAELAGLPPETGLYTTIASLVAYAALGPSRILVVGPDSSLAPLIAAVVLPLAAGPVGAVPLAGVLALLTGVACLLTGWLRGGTVTELFSRPVRIGYLNGLALIVVASQLPKLFGFQVEAEGFVGQLAAFWEGVVGGSTIPAALVLGFASLLLIIGVRHRAPRLPGVLGAVALAILAVELLNLEQVPVVGALPRGLPPPSLPRAPLDQLLPLAVGAIGIALVAFADTGALSTALALRRGEAAHPNREAVALGAANLAAGLLGGFPTSASSSRTAVAETAGSKSQLTGVMAGLAIVVLLLVAPGLLASLPSSVLAAVVIAAAFALFDLATLRWLWTVSRPEFLLSVGALVAVLWLGVLPGLGVAVALSLGNFVRNAWRPYSAVLGRLPDRKGYHDLARHPEAVRIPGLVLFRFDGPLFFANAGFFGRALEEALAASPTQVRWVVVAAEPVTDIDTTGAEMLAALLDDMDRRGVTLAFAELKGPAKDRLRAYGIFDRLGGERFYPTIGTAVNAYLLATGTVWVDPIEEGEPPD